MDNLGMEDYLSPQYDIPVPRARGSGGGGGGAGRQSRGSAAADVYNRVVQHRLTRPQTANFRGSLLATTSLAGTLASDPDDGAEQRVWSRSRFATAAFFFLFLPLCIGTMVGTVAVGTTACECLVFYLDTLTTCDYNLTVNPHFMPVAAATASGILSLLLVSVVVLMLSSRKTFSPTVHYVVLPLRQLWSHLYRKRKFWMQIFLCLGASGSIVYKTVRMKGIDELGEESYNFWNYTLGPQIAENVLTTVLMFLLNYTYPGPSTTKLSLLAYRLTIITMSLIQGIFVIAISFHISFKILPHAYTGNTEVVSVLDAITGNKTAVASMLNASGRLPPHAHANKSMVNASGAADAADVHVIMHMGPKDYDTRSVALILSEGAFRAGNFWFFFTKLFKPRKDLFTPVYDDLPRDDDSAHDGAGEG